MRDLAWADVRDSLASLERAAELLGYEAVVPLREGLAQTIEFFRKRMSEGAE